MRLFFFRIDKDSLLSIFFLGLFGFSPPFLSAEESSKNLLELESVTVTAEKREEDVQIVTTSTTVLSDITLEDAGIQSTQDIQGQVPNFKTAHNGSRDYFSSIHIRGISNTSIGDPAIALYIREKLVFLKYQCRFQYQLG